MFLITTALSTIVAAIGLTRDSSAVIIGAMVIAPLLVPNMALALATTLGDMHLAGRALKANGAGFAVTLGVGLLAGLLWPLDLSATEVASRTVVSFNEILLALATGTAGALAVTAGLPSSLVGVMVAVALLPPLVIAAALLVQGNGAEAAGAFLLLATNVICVNLSGVVTFYAQGIKPRTVVGGEEVQACDVHRAVSVVRAPAPRRRDRHRVGARQLSLSRRSAPHGGVAQRGWARATARAPGAPWPRRR